MNTKLDRVLSVAIGISYIAMLPIATLAVLPIIAIIIIAKEPAKTWHESVKAVYVDTPVAYLKGDVL